MSLSISDLFTPATADDYFAKMQSIAASLGLVTTSWQPGAPTRTIMKVLSQMLTTVDAVISRMAQGGYLDWAAKVTPEGGPGWLDVLAQYLFDELRTPAAAATGDLSLINASVSVYGPFAPGTFHVSDPTTHATYHNRDSLTIAASATTSAVFVADSVGSVSTAPPGGVTALVTSLIGVTCTNAAAWVGTDAQTNADLVSVCRLKLASFAQRTGPTDAYVYFAERAQDFLAPGSSLAGGTINRAIEVSDKLTGAVTVAIANAGGAPSGGDVTLVDGVIQAECVPDAVTAVTIAATNLVCTVALDVYIPSAYVTGASATILAALTKFFSTIPIGGTLKGAPPGVVSFDSVDATAIEALIAAGVPAEKIDTTLTINGGTADLTVTTFQVPVLDGASTITVHGV